MENKLTEKQQKFLDAYYELLSTPFPSTSDRLDEAKRIAGYSTGTRGENVLRGLSKEVIERTYEWAALHLPQALQGLIDIIDNPTKPGAKNLIAAATTIMDRGGLGKTEKLNIETDSPNAVLILPAKETNKD